MSYSITLGRIEDVNIINQLPEFDKNEIKDVKYNDPATIVPWSDGTKTTSKCDYRDKYNPEMGLILAVMKKIIDGKYVADLLHDWAPEEGQKRVALADVRKKYR